MITGFLPDDGRCAAAAVGDSSRILGTTGKRVPGCSASQSRSLAAPRDADQDQDWQVHGPSVEVVQRPVVVEETEPHVDATTGAYNVVSPSGHLHGRRHGGGL